MKERFNADLAYIVSCIVKEDEEASDNIGRSAACFVEGMYASSTRSSERLVSFCYVSAALCLREIERARRVPIYGGPEPNRVVADWAYAY